MSSQDDVNRMDKLAIPSAPAQPIFALDSEFAQIESEKSFVVGRDVSQLSQLKLNLKQFSSRIAQSFEIF